MVGEAGGGDKRSGTQAGTPGTPTTSDPLTFSNHAPVHSSSRFESKASLLPSRASLAPTEGAEGVEEELFLFIFFYFCQTRPTRKRKRLQESSLLRKKNKNLRGPPPHYTTTLLKGLEGAGRPVDLDDLIHLPVPLLALLLQELQVLLVLEKRRQPPGVNAVPHGL